MEGIWSFGASPVAAIIRIASASSRRAPLGGGEVFQLKVFIVAKEVGGTNRTISARNPLGLVMKIGKRQRMGLREALHIVKRIFGVLRGRRWNK